MTEPLSNAAIARFRERVERVARKEEASFVIDEEVARETLLPVLGELLYLRQKELQVLHQASRMFTCINCEGRHLFNDMALIVFSNNEGVCRTCREREKAYA